MWRVNKKTLELESLTGPYKFGSGRLKWGKKYKWKSGINTDKKCDVCVKESPISEERCSTCAYGFYSSKEPIKIQDNDKYIVGRIGIFGRVCEAEKGYRSQKAIPLSIVDAMGVSFNEVEQIAHKYNMHIDEREERIGLGIKVGLFGYIGIVLWLWFIVIASIPFYFMRPNLAEPLYKNLEDMIVLGIAYAFTTWMTTVMYRMLKDKYKLDKAWREYARRKTC